MQGEGVGRASTGGRSTLERRALRHKHLALLAKLATGKGLKFCLSKATPRFVESSSVPFNSHQNIEKKPKDRADTG